MQIAIASGKGGTGKTTISTALAGYMSAKGHEIDFVDCDVEEPNSNLFLKCKIDSQQKVTAIIPKVDLDKCNGCGDCEKICNFSAITVINKKPIVFNQMCHFCRGCFLVCKKNALVEKEKELGVIESGSKLNLNYFGGILKIGEIMTPNLIKQVKDKTNPEKLIIIDSPPGTSCPVIESLHGSDYVILVTDATPFGLHDLKLAAGLAKKMKLEFGVVINRHGLGNDEVEKYCKRKNIDIIAKIPNSVEIAKRYSKGEFQEYFVKMNEKSLNDIYLLLKSKGDF